MAPSPSRLLACLALLLFAAPAAAQAPAPPPDWVPGQLQGWIPWVLHGDEDLDCTRLNGGLTCDWPSDLTLKADATGGSFELKVWLDRAGRAVLPGGEGAWPQDVQVDGTPALVELDSSGAPAVKPNLPGGPSSQPRRHET